LLKKDKKHKEAVDLFEQMVSRELPYSKFYTSNFIVDEVVTFILYEQGHGEAVKALEVLRGSPFLDVLHVSGDVEARADKEFKKYEDHRISYTDCTTKALMDVHGIDTVFSFDADFEILGMQRIP
jgi:predicted nucleic acid-binding protein